MSVDWPFGVHLDNTIPVYVQIENHVRFGIASGWLKPGDLLPSVRNLAQFLSVNPNTITKSYRDLELLGIVETRRGVGVMVAKSADKVCTKQTRAMALDHLHEALAECCAAGIPDAELKKAIATTLKAKPYPYGVGK